MVDPLTGELTNAELDLLDGEIERLAAGGRLVRLVMDREGRRALSDRVLSTHLCAREREERFGSQVIEYAGCPVVLADTGGSIFLIAEDRA